MVWENAINQIFFPFDAKFNFLAPIGAQGVGSSLSRKVNLHFLGQRALREQSESTHRALRGHSEGT